MWKKAFFAGSFLLGLGLFIFVFVKFFDRQAFEAVVDFGWAGMAVYLPLAAMTLVAPAVAWMILMRADGLPVPLSTALKANLMGFPINFVAPTMFLGAEPLKMLYVSQVHGEPKRRVLATIIVAKFQEIGALLFVMIVAAAVSVWRIELTRNQEILLVASMALLATVFGFALYAFVGNLQPTVRVINALAGVKRWRRKLARLRTRAREMEHLIHAAFTKRWKTFLAAQAVTLLSALSILMRPWVFFYFSREHVLLGTETLCAIYLATNVINSLPHTPGSLGTFELAMVGTFALVGIGKDNAAAFALVTRAADVFLLLLGTWLIVHYGLQSVARRVAKGEETVSVHDAQIPDGDGAPPKEPPSA
jgi:uncharacterized protein (TIRG00374 family)